MAPSPKLTFLQFILFLLQYFIHNDLSERKIGTKQTCNLSTLWCRENELIWFTSEAIITLHILFMSVCIMADVFLQSDRFNFRYNNRPDDLRNCDVLCNHRQLTRQVQTGCRKYFDFYSLAYRRYLMENYCIDWQMSTHPPQITFWSGRCEKKNPHFLFIFF